MKRIRVFLILVVLSGLVLALVPAASAQPFMPMRSEATMELVFPPEPDVPHWIYTFSGDITGVARVDVLWTDIRGTIEHWGEVMVIETYDSATIVVESRGVWNLETYAFETWGVVTSADGGYEFLVGHRAQAIGYTSGVVPPLTGHLSFRIK